LISSKVNQWTLLIGMLPLPIRPRTGMSPRWWLDHRQCKSPAHAAQSFFGVAVIANLRFRCSKAMVVAALFGSQLFFTSPSVRYAYRDRLHPRSPSCCWRRPREPPRVLDIRRLRPGSTPLSAENGVAAHGADGARRSEVRAGIPRSRRRTAGIRIAALYPSIRRSRHPDTERSAIALTMKFGPLPDIRCWRP